MTFFPFDENLYTTDSRVNSIKIYGFFEKAKFGLRQYSLVSHSPFLVSYVQYLLVFAISSGYTSWLYCILQSWLYLLYFCILLGYVQYFSSLFYTLQSLLYLLDILIGCIVPYSFGYVLYLLVFAILFGYVQYPKVFAILLDILSVLCPEPSSLGLYLHGQVRYLLVLAMYCTFKTSAMPMWLCHDMWQWIIQYPKLSAKNLHQWNENQIMSPV